MKKNVDKLFYESINTYYFLLLIVVIIKLLGGNYFDIVQNNNTINMINNFITNWKLENVWYAITLYVNVYIIIAITCKENSKQIKKFCLISLPFIIAFQYIKGIIGLLGFITDLFYILVLSLIYMKTKHKHIDKINISNYIIVMVINFVTQMISMIMRGKNLSNVDNGFYINTILSLDYFLILIIVYKLYFMKGVENLCQVVVSSGSLKLTSLKNSLRDLHVKSQNKTELTKEDKITYMIYMPLYLLWNLFTMLIIVLIAILNNAMEEAIFITVAFWINKRVFGKPFHFKSVGMCFCFSSLAYYILTRITFHIETSLFIPIFLGVSLSYVTSNFIKKNYKLYKGMSLDLFNETIRQVTDDKLIIKMCKEYYCDRLNDVKIASINGYSIDSVRKKRQKINRELRNLEK